MRRAGCLLILIALIAAAPIGGALAASMTLADLQAGGEFDSGDGFLHFSGFSIAASGSVSSPLSDFEVLPLVDGFEIVGPISAVGGEVGSLLIDYTVTGVAPLREGLLSFNGSAAGAGAEARVNEVFGTLGSASVHAREGSLQLSDSALLGDTAATTGVSKTIEVVSTPSGIAQISQVTQRFSVVPEPTSLLLLGLGGLGTLLLRRRS